MQGRILHSLSGFYDVLSDDDHQIYRTRARGNFRKRGITPLVGDFVEFADGYLLKILPRTNQLKRPPVANIDQVVLVVSARQPDFSPNLLDRFLVSLAGHHIDAIIYLTKTDLLNDEEYQQLTKLLTGYRELGYQVLAPRQIYDAAVLHDLQKQFAQRVTIFTGQTGAGKSSLLNHLAPSLQLATGAISQSLNRGRHTTRQVSLYPLFDGLVADTPGFSSLNLSLLGVTLSDLAQRFPEFVAAAPHCKFRGCQHVAEPGCAVKQLLTAGQIMSTRYDDYLQFRDELKQLRPVYNKKK
ncbi:MAG: ribosome small subunit-dependent GTPase A [Candidatus Paralactobacillus gallistercoris]|uniref:Small ribosomal subunit biogenesis GTPase RsgA n=1 Tax=Candidatus Paralactobacillus gallistercoris TaxID=2838724 RepID=A0A948TJ73_9LACO|nr:ribosome small subunit-dependent GTPase A [Candidatus Paralactobacillus gallistercoris]